jgi:putative ABC transport system substrate-binding protein
MCTGLVVCLTAASTTIATAQVRQRPARIGQIWFQDAAGAEPYHRAFRDGMQELGYIEGRNVTYITRYAEGSSDRLPSLVAEMIDADVDVLYITPKAVPAAKQATTTIPIVSAAFYDPVAEGFANSLARPGGNVTGISWQSLETSGKRLELTMELMPGLKRVGVLYDPNDSGAVLDAKAVRSAAVNSGIRISALEVNDTRGLDATLAATDKDRLKALILIHSPLTVHHRERIVRFAIERRLPLVSEGRDMAEAGALLTYGPSIVDMFRRGAGYVDKILKGMKPRDLPIEQPTKFELVVNLKTAKALGITIPQSILVRADEVIR